MASVDYDAQLVAAPTIAQAYLGAIPAPEPEPEPEPTPEPDGSDWNRSPTTTAQRRRDAYLNPQTGDYVWTLGRQQRAEAAETRIYLALATRRGSVIGNATLGSRLHELRAEKSLQSRVVLAEDYAREALGAQVREGLLVDLSVSAELDSSVRGRINLHVAATDGLSGRPVVVTHPVG